LKLLGRGEAFEEEPDNESKYSFFSNGLKNVYEVNSNILAVIGKRLIILGKLDVRVKSVLHKKHHLVEDGCDFLIDVVEFDAFADFLGLVELGIDGIVKVLLEKEVNGF
jgi:hypothetical protein